MLDTIYIDPKDGRAMISVTGKYEDIARLQKYMFVSTIWYDLLQRINEGEIIPLKEINQALEGK